MDAQSRQSRPTAGRIGTETQELAVCLYLKRLDAIGTPARFPMVTSYADIILGHSHPDHVTTSPPTVGLPYTPSPPP